MFSEFYLVVYDRISLALINKPYFTYLRIRKNVTLVSEVGEVTEDPKEFITNTTEELPKSKTKTCKYSTMSRQVLRRIEKKRPKNNAKEKSKTCLEEERNENRDLCKKILDYQRRED